jgi:adenosylcobinamide-phosphate synthase
MSFLSILLALLLEQARPLAPSNPVHTGNRNWVRWSLRNFDAGRPEHGWLAWCVAVLLPAALACGVYWSLVLSLGWVFALAWNTALLYVTLGFRQFSHHFTQIRDALYDGDEALAREKLAEWMRIDASELPRSEILRHAIEHSLLSAHRHVFGVLAWYSVFSALGLGPAGAVLYRSAEYLAQIAGREQAPSDMPVSDALRASARHAWYLMDWVPARITALCFACVGSFEEAIDSWRRHEASHPQDNDGVIISAAAGAVNVGLGAQVASSGATPQSQHLRAIVGLVWRTVVMWMVLLALLTLARLIG